MIALHSFFSYICGQQHCWVLGGHELPFCQRCTGLYVGAFCAVIVMLIFRLSPNRLLYWVHGIFMLLMIPFGFHFVTQGGLLRTFTGTLFGFGLVYYLALNPFTAWHWWKSPASGRIYVYLLMIAIVLPLLLLTVRSGANLSAVILTSMGVLGFAALCLLIVMNLVVLPGTLSALRSRTSAPTA
jgi:uncharacterized membrane protein